MKRLKVCSLITAALLSASITMQCYPTYAKEGNNVDVQMFNTNTSETTNGVATKYKITNTGSEDVDLSQVKIRYYYTIDGEKAENFYCDSASKIEGYNYTGITSNVSGSFVKMDQPKEGADHYLEISFGSEAGKLAAGGVVEIQGRFAKEDWSNLNQSNDYSFNSATSYTSTDKTVVFVNDQQVSGVIPSKDVAQDPAQDPDQPRTPTGNVTVDTINGTTATSTNTLNPTFKVKNSSDKAVKLSDLKLKYFYNSDGDEKENFFCDYAAVTTGGYRGLTGNVKGTINPFAAADGSTTTNTYLEIGFDDASGTLEPGQEMVVQTRISKENWSNFDQSNDFSFNANGAAAWQNVVAEVDGKVIFGQGPIPIIDSVIDPKVATEDKNVPTDIPVNIEYNRNTLTAIKYKDKVLKEGQDYTVTADGVVLSKDFLKTLPKGDAVITFDFNQGNDADLKVTVIKTHIVDSVITPTTADVDRTNPKDIAVDVQYNGNELLAVKNGDKVLEKGKDYTIVGGKVVLSKSYLAKLPKGQVVLTFDFDDGNDPTLTLNVTGDISSILDKEQADFNRVSPADITVGIEYNGNTLKAIRNGDKVLVEGKDYTIVNGKVVLSKDYLSQFVNGQITLVFDFDSGNDPTLIINVVGDLLDVKVGDVNGKPGDTVVVPVTVKGIEKDKAVYGYNFRLQYDTTKFENVKVEPGKDCPNPTSTFHGSILPGGIVKVLYMNSSSNDDPAESIGQDGVLCNVTMTIKDTAARGASPVTFATKGTFQYMPKDAQKSKPYKVNFADGSVFVERDIVDSKINPVSIDVDRATVKDTTIKVEYNGNILKAVKNGDKVLVEGKDYTIVDGNVVLSKDYLAQLPDGQSTITIDMDAGNDPILTVNVSGHLSSVLYKSQADFDKTNPADITVGIDYKGNTLKAIKNGDKVLVEGKDYTIVNGKVVLSKDYLSQFINGQITLVFDFDNGNDPTLVIDVVGDLLDVKVGEVTGNPGDTVVVPVTVKGIQKDKGVYGYNFRLQYDTTKFENVKVEPGKDCPNPTSTFHGSILPGGIVKVLYMNSTSNDDPAESIGQDGVLCNVTMTIKDTASKGVSPVTFATKGTFQYMPKNAQKSKPYKVNFADGSVNIGGQPPVSKDAKLKETEVNFDQTNPADITVGVEYNGNTLKAIKNGNKVLVEGKDYTIVNGQVVLSKDYLSQFTGQITLVFDFDNGNDPTLIINVVGDLLDVKVADVNGNPGDTVVVPVTVKGIEKDKAVYGYNFRLQYDTTKFENVKVEPATNCPNPTSTFHGSILPGGIVKVLYMNSTSNDDPTESIGQDGVLCNITMTIKDTASKGTSPITFATKGTFQYMPTGAEKSKPYKVNFADGSVNIGGQPPVSKDAKLKETEVNFDQTKPADISVGIEYNNNTLKTITNGSSTLVKGEDYTEGSNGVVLSKTYLSKLPLGQTTLKFTFSNGSSETLTVKVSKTEVVVDSKLANTKVEFDQSKPADISVGIEYNGNTIEAIKNGDTTLVKGEDYTEGSNGIVLSKTYLGKLPLGQATLNFVFNHGNAQSLIVNVIKTDVPVTTPLIKTDAVNVKVGETFNVPVLIKNIPTGGILSASLNLNYDTSVLECTGYEFGSIIPSKGDADGNIIPASKFIGIGYMPIGKANAEIKEEGVFVTLKFKVKDTAAKGETAITEFRKTTLLDTNKKRVPVTVQFGKININ